MYFLYTSEFQHKYISLHKVYFKYTRFWKQIHLFRKSNRGIYTSEFEYEYIHKFRKSILIILLSLKKCINSKSIHQVYIDGLKKKYLKPTWKILEKYSKKYFFSVTNFGNQNISKSTLEEYFIFRIYTEVYLKYSYISAGQNTNKSLHNLWNNGLVVRVQLY